MDSIFPDSKKSQQSYLHWWTNHQKNKSNSVYIEVEGFKLEIPKGVFSPDTMETLSTQILLNTSIVYENKSVLDLGTGSGILAFHALKHGAAKVVATDIDQFALDVAKHNAELNEIDVKKIDFVHSDLFSNLGKQRFDIITANLPILDSAWKNIVTDSMQEIYSHLFMELKDWLSKSGSLYLCFASFGNVKKLEKIVADNNLKFSKDSYIGFGVEWFVYQIRPNEKGQIL